jgi:hypothetical protein
MVPPLGEPGNRNQQRTILKELFGALYRITEPGTIIDLPYRWRRDEYEPVDFSQVKFFKDKNGNST